MEHICVRQFLVLICLYWKVIFSGKKFYFELHFYLFFVKYNLPKKHKLGPQTETIKNFTYCDITYWVHVKNKGKRLGLQAN